MITNGSGSSPLAFAAPLQGLTEAAFRHFHAELYSPAPDRYFSPFMQVDKGRPRQRNVRDITSPLNANHRLVPQIIFKSLDELKVLTDNVRQAGYTEINLNMGCPFPPQVHKGRGAGILRNTDEMRHVAEYIGNDDSLSYSLKMRLGTELPDEWQNLTEILNAMPLEHITVHPRTARQQYSGALHMEQVALMLAEIHHPIIFNGEISTPQDITDTLSRLPSLAGIMIGRGLLSRPSLIEEWKSQREMSHDERMERIMRIHDGILSHYSESLCGDTQILSKIKAFWEYLEPEIGHKPAKNIRKARNMDAYLSAIDAIK